MTLPVEKFDCLTDADFLNLLADSAAFQTRVHLDHCCHCRARFTSYGRALRRQFRWSIASGLAIGFLVIAALLQPLLNRLCHNLALTYAGFPSLSTPWLARINFDFLPAWGKTFLLVISVVSIHSLGLLVTWRVRSPSLAGDVRWGAVAGLGLGSVICFPLTWSFSLALVPVRSLGDLELLRDGGHGAEVQAAPEPAEPTGDARVEKYPDLGTVREPERAKQLHGKIVADQATGSLDALLLGLPAGLSLGLALGVCQTVVAGFLFRHRAPWYAFLPAYAICSVVVAFILVACVLYPLCLLVNGP